MVTLFEKVVEAVNVDFELLCDHVQQHIETDPDYADEDEAAFDFLGERIFYTRYADHYVLEVQGLTVECPRL